MAPTATRCCGRKDAGVSPCSSQQSSRPLLRGDGAAKDNGETARRDDSHIPPAAPHGDLARQAGSQRLSPASGARRPGHGAASGARHPDQPADGRRPHMAKSGVTHGTGLCMFSHLHRGTATARSGSTTVLSPMARTRSVQLAWLTRGRSRTSMAHARSAVPLMPAATLYL